MDTFICTHPELTPIHIRLIIPNVVKMISPSLWYYKLVMVIRPASVGLTSSYHCLNQVHRVQTITKL